jgi:hypothetical protein
MAKFAEQRENFLLIDCCHHHAGGNRAQPKAGCGRMREQRRSLRLVRHVYVATGRANPNAPVMPTYVVD